MLRFPRLLLIGWLLAALCGGASAAEDGYPSRLVKVIVPFPPGSTLDALARIVTDQLAHTDGASPSSSRISAAAAAISERIVSRVRRPTAIPSC
jgi:tripartite-type tricarboxylate transporter receptor subunit TctC